MKAIKFLEQFQEDLFPDRSTVGWEVEQVLLGELGADPALTEDHEDSTPTEPRAQQQRLPMQMPRRRRLGRRGFVEIELLIIGAIIATFVGLVSWVFHAKFQEQDACTQKIVGAGYDEDAVRVFLKAVDLEACDFLASKGLQAQYARFQAGQESVGRRAAGDRDRAEANGIAVGIAIGSGGRR